YGSLSDREPDISGSWKPPWLRTLVLTTRTPTLPSTGRASSSLPKYRTPYAAWVRSSWPFTNSGPYSTGLQVSPVDSIVDRVASTASRVTRPSRAVQKFTGTLTLPRKKSDIEYSVESVGKNWSSQATGGRFGSGALAMRRQSSLIGPQFQLVDRLV